jgi:hypothetical protein
VTTLETDYLVVGAGTSGVAFTDALVAHDPTARVVLVDRRPAAGGHWLDGYPFLRLHLPSAYYGVASVPLGEGRLEADGGYERAGRDEVLAHFATAVDKLLATSRVQVRFGHEHVERDGRHVVRDAHGAESEVLVQRALVDARYLETSVPATHRRPFDVADGVRCVPVGELPSAPAPEGRYVVLGAGKTAMDAVQHLLDEGVDPDRVRWVRPRDLWLLDRAGWQPLDQVATMLDGLAAELEETALATDVADLMLRLERVGRLVRVDPEVVPTAYHGGSVSQADLAQLRRVRDVVRLGHVLRVEPDRLVLEAGELPADPGDLYVDATARGLRLAPPQPVFAPGRVVLQQVRSCTPSFNAALIGVVEASGRDLDDKNRLCPPNPLPDTPADWLSNCAVTLDAGRAWSKEPDLPLWVDACRLNLLAGLSTRVDDPAVAAAMARYGAALKPARARLEELLAT